MPQQIFPETDFAGYTTTVDEQARLRTLAALHVLHTAPEERFDRITRLACRIFDVPFAFITLVAEHYQWTKSQAGDAVDIDVLPREQSFCAQAMSENDVLVIPDLAGDPRFMDSPLVSGPPYMAFYAGRPLRAANGHALGALCIVDRAPRFMSEHELTLLDDLGVLVERELEAANGQATVDTLTGAINRRGFESLAPCLLESCRLNRRTAALLYFELAPAHAFGTTDETPSDDTLQCFARIVIDTTRAADLFARVGETTFALLAGKSDAVGAERIIERLDEALAAAHRGQDDPERIAYRHGVSTVEPHESVSLDNLLDDARLDAVRARETVR
ncbi:GAF domain-containing protein [Salinisphaera sp. Q1T1-3]|uniref:GAF domain-containing protein n=1 Tax=Salinisphaera sp. Q1T1-3 TaxID=2321229 RepID=UPI000E76BDB0|nr:GAF domain-containing protein [Salinisphaera sp. Q1T1-3]RJS93260.1 GAF domain-containing protein [Salinisphaera sp. Q1T1-3]